MNAEEARDTRVLRHFAAREGEWTRAVYVGQTNHRAQYLVERGWLEQRPAERPPGYIGNTATEYRVTLAGRAHLTAVSHAPV